MVLNGSSNFRMPRKLACDRMFSCPSRTPEIGCEVQFLTISIKVAKMIHLSDLVIEGIARGTNGGTAKFGSTN